MARRPTKGTIDLPGAPLGDIPSDMMTPAIRAQIEAAKAQISAATTTEEAATELKEAVKEQKETSKKEFREKAKKVSDKDIRITYPALSKLIKAAIAERDKGKDSKEAAEQNTRLDEVAERVNIGNEKLTSLITGQKESNKILGEVLKTLVDIKKEGLGGKSSLAENLLEAAANSIGAGGGEGKGKPPSAAPNAKPSVMQRAGGLVKGAGPLTGAISAYNTYNQTGNLGQAAASGVGAFTGLGVGAAAGGAIGALPFLSIPTAGLSIPIGSYLGGGLGAALGSKAGETLYASATGNDQSAAVKELENKSKTTQNGVSVNRAASVFPPTPTVSALTPTTPSLLTTSGGGGGGANIQAGPAGKPGKALAANQQEAYAALRAEGLSESAAKIAVANLSGEALHKPGDIHADPSRRNPNQKAHGIASWDDARSARIQKQFGKMPNEMTVAEQSKAFAWEMKTHYKKAWADLNNEELPANQRMYSVVKGFENPAHPDQDTARRLGIYGGLGKLSDNPTTSANAGAESQTSTLNESQLAATQARFTGNAGTSGVTGAAVTPAVGSGRGSGELEMAARKLDAVKQQYATPDKKEQTDAEVKAAFEAGASPLAGYETSISTAPIGSGRGSGSAEMIQRAQDEYDAVLKKTKAESAPKPTKAAAPVVKSEGGQPVSPGRGRPDIGNIFGGVLAGALGGMGGGRMFPGGMPMRPPVVARQFPGAGMPNIGGMLGGMLGGRMGGRSGGLFGSIAGGLLQNMLPQIGDSLSRSSAADQMSQREPKQVMQQTQGGGGGAPNIGKPSESDANQQNVVGNVEPVDAATRFRKLFGITA